MIEPTFSKRAFDARQAGRAAKAIRLGLHASAVSAYALRYFDTDAAKAYKKAIEALAKLEVKLQADAEDKNHERMATAMAYDPTATIAANN